MRRNLELTRGLIFSESVLLALVEAGMAREDAYRVVQDAAAECWQSGEPLADVLSRSESTLQLLGQPGLAACFDIGDHIQIHIFRINRITVSRENDYVIVTSIHRAVGRCRRNICINAMCKQIGPNIASPAALWFYC